MRGGKRGLESLPIEQGGLMIYGLWLAERALVTGVAE